MPTTDELTKIYGDPAFAPPERVFLRAGAWSLIYEGGDLKYLRYGNTEVVRRIYVAVRDERWGTIPGTIHEVEREIGEESFRLVYDARHVNEEKGIDFSWRGTLNGTADGVVTFDMEGKSAAPFSSNRTGICVLHPSEAAGEPVTVRHNDGSEEAGEYPDLIKPDQPFFDIVALTQTVAPGIGATIGFDGEVFEMEDQRNYLDASYKTYSRPQAWQKPYTVSPDEPIHQTVTVSLHPSDKPMPVVVNMGWGTDISLPEIGLVLPADGPLPQAETLPWVQHYRVDVDAATDNWQEAALRAETAGYEAGLILGVRNAAQLPDDLPRFQNLQAVFLLNPGDDDLKRARELFGDNILFAASDRNFTSLNMNRPEPGSVAGVAFSANPQVHSTDNTSIMETPYNLPQMVETARSWDDSFRIALGPTELAGYRKREDARHRGLMGAAWYAAMYCYAVQSRVDYYTVCDAIGPGGVLSSEGHPYPVFHVLQAVADTEAEYIETTVSDPLRVAAVATVADPLVILLLVNLTPDEQEVVFLPVSDPIHVSVLDTESLPSGFSTPAEMSFPDKARISLSPFVVAKITMRNSE
ncbi:MAG: hypothetical protein OHK0029_39490 [Armatimonadaceae bacterium]